MLSAVTSSLAERGFDVSEHQQSDDHLSDTLFHTSFTPGVQSFTANEITDGFAGLVDVGDAVHLEYFGRRIPAMVTAELRGDPGIPAV